MNEEKDFTVASLINSLVKDEWEAVEGYNSAIATLSDFEGEAVAGIIANLEDIRDEEYVHIGQLQSCLSTLTENPIEQIDDGAEEGLEKLELPEDSEDKLELEEPDEEPEELSESLLLENKVVTFNGKTYPNSGWCIILAGGASSGKSKQFDYLVPINGKKYDPDDIKVWKVDKSELAGDVLTFNTGEEYNLTELGIEPPYNLHNPEFSNFIHQATRLSRNKFKNNIYKSMAVASNKGLGKDANLPNIIFDVTASNLGDIEGVLDYVKPLGYKVALVYIFTPIELALKNLKKRFRTLRVGDFLSGHYNVLATLSKLKDREDLIESLDEIWAVLSIEVDFNDKKQVYDMVRAQNVFDLKDGNKLALDELKNESVRDFIEQDRIDIVNMINQYEREPDSDYFKMADYDEFNDKHKYVGKKPEVTEAVRVANAWDKYDDGEHTFTLYINDEKVDSSYDIQDLIEMGRDADGLAEIWVDDEPEDYAMWTNESLEKPKVNESAELPNSKLKEIICGMINKYDASEEEVFDEIQSTNPNITRKEVHNLYQMCCGKQASCDTEPTFDDYWSELESEGE